MATETYQMTITTVFTALAAISAYLAVTRGAVWSARDLDKIDPIKIRLKELQESLLVPDEDGLIREAVLHLRTGQFVFVAKIHNVGYQAIRLHGCFADSYSSDVEPQKIASDLTIRYSIIASVSF